MEYYRKQNLVVKASFQWPKPLGPLSLLLLTSRVTLSIFCLNICCLWNSLYSKDFRIKNFTCSSFCSLFSCQQIQESGSKKGGFWAGLLVWNDCSTLSVLLCVSAKKLLEVLIKCSVLGKVSSPHVKYMEGRRFYLSVCELGRSCCQNKMTHFRSDILLTEERAASQLICMFVWVPEWIMHTPAFYFSSHGQQICS